MSKFIFCVLLLGGVADAAEPVTKSVFVRETGLAKDAPPLFAPTGNGVQPVLALVNIRSLKPIKDAPSPCVTAPGTLCMSTWFRYELSIRRVLAGREARKSVSVVTAAHALPTVDESDEYRPDALAILVPDEQDDPNRPKADYRLKRLIRPSYCFTDALAAYGLKSDKGDGAGCHSAESIRSARDRDEDEDPPPQP